jgi:membrane protease YdiL (CAAX protease family)
MRHQPHLRRAAIGFSLLFVAYQIPEAIGQRLLGSFFVQAILMSWFFVVAYFVGRTLGPTALKPFGLEYSKSVMRPFLASFFFAVAIKVAAVAGGTGLGIYAAAGVPGSGIAATLLTGLVITFAPSIAEDIVTRGFWFRASRIRWRPHTFLLASSGIFVLNHIYRLGSGPGEWLMLLGFGLTYALAVVRFGSLWPAVGLHWGWNYGNLLVNTVRPMATLSGSHSKVLSVVAHAGMAVFILWVAPGCRRDSLEQAD